MEQFSKSRRKMLFILLSGLILFFCSTASLLAETPKAGGEIKVRIRTDLVSTDPYKSTALINANVLGHILEPLLAYNENLKIVPVVAERWEASNDYKTYTFHLIKGKKFHNGQEMTAEDVNYSIKRMMNPETCARAKLFDGVDRIEVVDKYTIKIHLQKSAAGFPHALAVISPLMAILPKGEAERQGGEIKHPVGTGPFKFVEWKPDRHVILEKFENYKGQAGPRDGMGGERIAYLDKVTFVPVPEESVSIMSLLNKEVDLMTGFPPKYMDKYRDEYSKKGVKVQEIPGLVWVGVHFGVTQPVVDNVQFRQACAYALDIEQLAKAAFMGYAEVNPSAVAKSNQYWTSAHELFYKQDTSKSKELLKKSGYNGEEILLTTTKKYNYFYKMAVAAHAQLQAVGINVKLNVVDWPVLAKGQAKGELQMYILGASPMPDPALAYAYLFRNKFLDVYPDVEELRQQALNTADVKARTELFEQIHKLCYERVPWVLSCNYNRLQAHWDYVKGYQVLSTSVPRLWGVWLEK